jgi:hypothetical protein
LSASQFPILPIFPSVVRCRDRKIRAGIHHLEQQVAIVDESIIFLPQLSANLFEISLK